MLKAIPTVTRMQLSLIFLSSVDFREQSAEMSFTLPPLKQKFPPALLFTSDYVCRCWKRNCTKCFLVASRGTVRDESENKPWSSDFHRPTPGGGSGFPDAVLNTLLRETKFGLTTSFQCTCTLKHNWGGGGVRMKILVITCPGMKRVPFSNILSLCSNHAFKYENYPYFSVKHFLWEAAQKIIYQTTCS